MLNPTLDILSRIEKLVSDLRDIERHDADFVRTGQLKTALFHLQGAQDLVAKVAEQYAGWPPSQTAPPPTEPDVPAPSSAPAKRCPACDGGVSVPPGDSVGECMSCGGMIGIEPISCREALSLVELEGPMLRSAHPDHVRYFDLVVAGEGSQVPQRVHGYYAIRTRRVVQFG